MIKLRRIISEIMEVTNSPMNAPIIQNVTNAGHSQEISSDFINYIKSVENSSKVGFDKNKKLWYPYKDIAGWHIGYGHKLENDELKTFQVGIQDKDVDKLLTGDLSIAKKRIDEYIKRVYKVNLSLSKKQEEALLDFSFNLGGIDKFPKFVDAVLKNRWDLVKQEYIRKSAGKEIKGRNQAFYNRFLK